MHPAAPPSVGPTGIPLLQLVKARLLEFMRQPEAIFWVYLFPILMVAALGIAFRTTPVEKFDVLIEDSSRGRQTAATLRGFESEATDFDVAVLPAEIAANRLRTGKASLVIGFADQKIVYKLDPTRPGSLAAKSAVDDALQTAAGRENPLATVEEMKREPGGRYIDFLVPGLLGMGLMGGGLFGVGFAIVDLRIRKLLKLFLATPMRRTDFLASLMISRMVFMIPEVILLLVCSWLLFGVVVYGSWFAMAVLIVLGAVEFAGIGLLIASRARSLEAASGLLNLAMLPMWTLCGVFFSYDRFPESLHPLIKLLPLTPLIDSLRAVMLEAAPLSSQWPELLVMIGWGSISFVLALLIFRWHD